MIVVFERVMNDYRPIFRRPIAPSHCKADAAGTGTRAGAGTKVLLAAARLADAGLETAS
jgi:hypothetical protein